MDAGRGGLLVSVRLQNRGLIIKRKAAGHHVWSVTLALSYSKNISWLCLPESRMSHMSDPVILASEHQSCSHVLCFNQHRIIEPVRANTRLDFVRFFFCKILFFFPWV